MTLFTVNATLKFTAMATAPNPSGEMPNHHFEVKPVTADVPPLKTPNLYFRIVLVSNVV